jgi:hypothetical protein
MSLTVNQRPNQYNAWVASGNPILYKMQRKDYNITAVANSGGALQVTVNANLATLATALGGPVIAGSILWVTTDNGAYNAAYTVVTCTNAANSVITFTAGTYSVAATTGYVNLVSNRTSYNVEAELYRQTDNTLIFSKLSCFPTASGLVTIDVSILNEYVDQEPFTYLSTTTNANTLPKIRRNTTTNLGFYIKYTEVWTSSAESQTSDSANPSWVVKGARQIGDLYGGYLKEYSEPNATPTRKFLTRFTSPILWPGRKSTLSFIDSDVSTTIRTLVKKTRYNSDNSVWGATYDLPEYAGSTVKGIHDVFEDLSTPYALLYDKENGAGTSWTNLGTATPIAVTLAAAASSKMAYFPLYLILAKTYEVKVSVTVAAGAGAETVKVRISAMTLAGTVRYTVDSANLSQNTTTEITFSAIIPATSDTYFFGIEIIHNGGVNGRTATLNYARVTIPTAYRVDFQIVTLTSTIAATETVVSETLTHYVQDTPDNVVQLFWKNSLGGDANYVFGFSQEYNYRFQNGKRKRMILYLTGLTAADFEAINELNSSGEVYTPSIVELSTSVNKTHVKRGAQVYSVDASGNKTGVIVIPTENRTATRRIQHNLEVTIELPETQEPR